MSSILETEIVDFDLYAQQWSIAGGQQSIDGISKLYIRQSETGCQIIPKYDNRRVVTSNNRPGSLIRIHDNRPSSLISGQSLECISRTQGPLTEFQYGKSSQPPRAGDATGPICQRVAHASPPGEWAATVTPRKMRRH
ncbi:hypothetical protein CEXT_588901 [Caerostris extrusa]|uniref:Uncharacterized protein n=1 Tax=Caerostris extrusa TaxID=172846 RepID=A0AAV4TMP9_CAEEX|nr:hypothetical protein CEXT_588901 [Caerostris extrusa]